MSKLADLIQKLCPDGVELKSLHEIGTFIRGAGIQKTELSMSGFPAIHYGEIHTKYELSADTVFSYIDKPKPGYRKVQTNDLIIVTTSEDLAGVGKPLAWVGKESPYLSGETYIVRHLQNAKYLAYLLENGEFQIKKLTHITGTKVKRIHESAFAKIRFPIPPIEVQNEIVLILDKFRELEAELNAELEARKIQYSEFLRTTFDFSDRDDVKWAAIGEVCSTFSGAFVKKTEQDDDFVYPVFNGGSTATGYYSNFNSPENSIAISARGSIGAVNWVPTKFWAGNSCHVVRATDLTLNNRFLYHYLKFHEPSLYALRAVGSIPALNLKPLLKFTVPIPPLEVQSKISEVLDKFEALINDIFIGLPAEIAARRQQYEYYRNKLLTFKELEVA